MQEKRHKIAVVGTDKETSELRSSLAQSDYYEIVKCLDPEKQMLNELTDLSDLDMIVNLSGNPSVHRALKKLNLSNTDIVSNLSAELLYCTIVRDHKQQISEVQWKVLETLQDLRRSVNLTKNTNELLKQVLSIALRSLDADSGSIMLSDPQKRTLTIEMSQGLEHDKTISTVLKYGKSIAGKVVRSAKPIIIKGHAGDGRKDVMSAICCPLKAANTVIGVININSKKPQRTFGNTDLHFVTRLAGFTADIIKTSKEYTQRSHATLSHSLLSGTRDILNLDFPLQERLNLLLMKIVNSFQGIMCNFYMFDKDSETFIVYGSSSFDINRIQTERIRLNDFFTGRVLRNKEAFTFQVSSKKSGTKKWFIAHPLFLENELFGLLLLHLVSDNERVDRGMELLGKVVSMLEQEFSKTATLGTAQLSSIKYSALSELTFDLAGLHDVRKIAKLIVTNACLIMEAESCILSLYNETMNCFEPLESFSLKGQKQINILQKVDKAIALNASVHNNAVLIPDLLSKGFVSETIPSRSVISMCLRKEGKMMAMLSVYDKNRFGIYDRKGFSRLDKEVFTKYCFQTAKTLNRFLLMKTK